MQEGHKMLGRMKEAVFTSIYEKDMSFQQYIELIDPLKRGYVNSHLFSDLLSSVKKVMQLSLNCSEATASQLLAQISKSSQITFNEINDFYSEITEAKKSQLTNRLPRDTLEAI